jgi:hypothetical protein
MATKPASEVNINDYYVGESIESIIGTLRHHRDTPTRNEALDLIDFAVRALKEDGVIGYRTETDDVIQTFLQIGDVPETEMVMVADTRNICWLKTNPPTVHNAGVIERKKKPVLVETK